MLKFKNTYISSLFGIKSNFEFQKFCEIYPRFAFSCLTSYHKLYHLRNARNSSLRTTYIIPPSLPPPPPPALKNWRLRPRLVRLIVGSHLSVKKKKPGYEPSDCVLLVTAFGRSIVCPGSYKVS